MEFTIENGKLFMLQTRNGKRTAAAALKIAVDYTLESIRETTKDPKANWYGVNFESAIPMLVHSLGR